jgi:hypothetical protein
MPCLYKISINNYYYWGISSRTLEARKNEHISRLRAGNGINRFMQNVYNKYGDAAFNIEVIVESDDFDIIKQLEIDHVSRDKDDSCCMNWKLGGEAPGLWWKGKTQSSEHIEKRTKHRRGTKASDTAKANIKASWTEERRSKVVQAITISKDNITWLDFNSIKEAANYIGGNGGSLSHALQDNKTYKGWSLKRIGG